jgi:hypothetical protein
MELPFETAFPTNRMAVPPAAPSLNHDRGRSFINASKWIAYLMNDRSWWISGLLHAIVLVAIAFLIVPNGRNPRSIVMEGAFTDAARTDDVMAFDLSESIRESQLLNEVPTESIIASAKTGEGISLDSIESSSLPTSIGIAADIQAANEMSHGASGPASTTARFTDGRFGDKKAELLRIYGGSAETEEAVLRGLAWLARQQQSDGSWSFTGPYSQPSVLGENQNSATAMALLAFLGAGHTQQSGEFSASVEKGLRWLIKQQAENGSFGEDKPRHHSFYTHAQSSIALCEAYGITRDEKLRPVVDKTTRYLVRAQGKEGGWRYEYQGDSDTSVTGWCLMALMSARSASVDIPEPTLRRVNSFLNTVDSENGALYGYVPRMPATPAMTAEGLLCRMYLGWAREHKGVNAGLRELSSKYKFVGQDRSYYYWYYATQVMHHAGGKDWEEWNQAMKPQLLSLQIPTSSPDGGSWEPGQARFDRLPGRLFSTCMALYCLEVYYRHLPIYQSPW